MDLTNPDAPDNLTKYFEKNYAQIGQAEDEGILKQWAIDAANHYHDRGGFSRKNFVKFMRTIESAEGMVNLQSFLTNFMMKGAGLGVMRNSIESIASMIQEDSALSIKLTTEQIMLKKLVEDNSDFKVGLLDD